MAYEQKELTGSLFKNKKKQTDKHPDTNGSALINDVEYWVSGWTKTTQNGEKWISLAFKPKEGVVVAQEADHRQPPKPGGPKAFGDMDDSIPF